MRILILVLSYTETSIYAGLMQAQQETWDSIKNPDIATVYYTGSGCQIIGQNGSISIKNDIPCADDYYLMHWKLKLCLDEIKHLITYDFIFRTNSSSYINKQGLLKRAETLPKEKCLAGWSLGEKEAVSGAGIWLSPDMVSILRDEIPAGENIEEDILIGRILHGKYGVEILDDRSRFDITNENLDYADLGRYHYRFRTPSRLDDIKNIYQLHRRIQNIR